MSEESKQWYLMDRPLFNSGFEDDEFYSYGKDGFLEVLDSFIGKNVRIHEKHVQDDPIEVRAIIQNVTSDVANSTYVRQILCEIGHLHCGQYVECDGAFWLVATLPDNNQIYEKAVLWKCKHTVRFVSPLSGEPVEYPVYSINSTQYGTGENEKQHITVGDAQHLIYIPYNEETIMIDDRFRFLIDRNEVRPSAFRVTQVDTMSYAVGDDYPEDGLLQWTVIETQFNAETDDKESLIADAFEKNESAQVGSEKSGDVIYLTDRDGDCKLTVGEDKVISVTYGGRLLHMPGVSYESSLDCDPDCAFIKSKSRDVVVISAADRNDNIGKWVTLTIQSGNAEAKMRIQIVGW